MIGCSGSWKNGQALARGLRGRVGVGVMHVEGKWGSVSVAGGGATTLLWKHTMQIFESALSAKTKLSELEDV